MDPQQKQDLKDKVLSEINSIRSEWMLDPIKELPKGTQSEVADCVVAKALSAGLAQTLPAITGEQWAMYDATAHEDDDSRVLWTYKPSLSAAALINQFDSGEFPELVEGEVVRPS